MNKKAGLAAFHRERILAAAEKLFLEQGFDGTTMANIAKEADYSKTTIYAYFASKQEIYYVITYQSFLKLREDYQQAAANYQDFFSGYQAVCQILVNFQAQYPLYFETLMETIALDLDHPVLHDIYTVGEEINQIIEEMLKRGIAEGIVRDDLKFPAAILTLWSSIAGVIRFADKKEWYIEDATQQTKQAFRDYSFDVLLQSILRR